MTTTPISPELIQELLPNWYNKDCDYKLLQNNSCNVGFMSMKNLGHQTCELGLLIFTEFRNKLLQKNVCYRLLDCIKSLGFMTVIFSTTLRGLKTIAMKYGGFEYLHTTKNKHWLKLEIAQNV